MDRAGRVLGIFDGLAALGKVRHLDEMRRWRARHQDHIDAGIVHILDAAGHVVRAGLNGEFVLRRGQFAGRPGGRRAGRRQALARHAAHQHEAAGRYVAIAILGAHEHLAFAGRHGDAALKAAVLHLRLLAVDRHLKAVGIVLDGAADPDGGGIGADAAVGNVQHVELGWVGAARRRFGERRWGRRRGAAIGRGRAACNFTRIDGELVIGGVAIGTLRQRAGTDGSAQSCSVASGGFRGRAAETGLGHPGTTAEHRRTV